MPQGRLNKKVVISGSTGFIGTALSTFLESNGYEVVRLRRHHFNTQNGQLANLLSGSSVVINLAGAPIAARKWTARYKKEIRDSRIQTTKMLVETMRAMPLKPELFISTSAVGIYDRYEVHDEFSTNYAGNFLGTVCKQWEAAACQVQRWKDVRLCVVRLGVVLGNEGGAFPRMLAPFKWGMGAPLGEGYQVFPFIHLNDLLSAFWYLICRVDSRGIFNMVAPQMISNLEITKVLQQRIHRSLLPAVPASVLKVLMGEGASMLLEGQKVVPRRLQDTGFHFQFPTFDDVLDDLLY
ncbi:MULTISPECIES: TIGR01777 family oxidoreductase [unclassified Carboxylicivirga]|uniref:TIGR01777 family oxidoreductase n=1 Tax=Carboxylicivirga TaxID=1628153 RepID=UPI003D33E7A2